MENEQDQVKPENTGPSTETSNSPVTSPEIKEGATVSPAPAQDQVPVTAEANPENTQNYPENEPKDQKAEEKKETISLIRPAIILVIILLAAWYFARGQDPATSTANNSDQTKIVVSDAKEQGNVKIVDNNGENLNGVAGSETISSNNAINPDNLDNLSIVVPSPNQATNTVKIVAYYSNTKNDPNLTDCSKVYPLARMTDKKYDSPVINTLRGLLTPLADQEKAAGFVSAIPAGVTLSSVKIIGTEAEVHFSNQLSTAAGSCAVTAIRSQVEQTLKQFSYIKSIKICIASDCNQSEILQP